MSNELAVELDWSAIQPIAEAALEAAGVPKMLARITELEKQIATIRGTVEAHNVRLESCDRDGQEFCDCLERAMKSAEVRG